MKLLSLLLPTYNREDKIKSLIQFLEKQDVFSNNEIEVIVSNNNSTDGTKAFLESLSFPNLIVINQKINLGAVKNINYLTNISKGKYFWIMGDNDIYYEGCINKVFNYINEYGDISHFFLNYASTKNKLVLQQNIFTGEDKIYENGIRLLYDLPKKDCLCALMFISANIFRHDIAADVNKIINDKQEQSNMALPLGYSIYATKYKCMRISEILLENDASTLNTWKGEELLVYCRDMIAMYESVASTLSNHEQLREYLISHMPAEIPEYKYMIFGRKFHKNNYTLYFYKKYCPYKLVIDLIKIPYIGFRFCIRIIKRRYKKVKI